MSGLQHRQGDIQLHHKMEGIEFGERRNCRRPRRYLTVRQRSATGGSSSDDRKVMYKVMAWAEEQFHRYLVDTPEAEIARRYFDDRITEKATERFKIRFFTGQLGLAAASCQLQMALMSSFSINWAW